MVGKPLVTTLLIQLLIQNLTITSKSIIKYRRAHSNWAASVGGLIYLARRR
jgi:hypothetical protein